MRSIRSFLVIVLVSVVTLANFLAAVRGYVASMEEAERLFNARMAHYVDILNFALLRSPERPPAGAAALEFPITGGGDGSGLEFQWLAADGALLARSHLMPSTPVAELKPGFAYANVAHHRWHVLVAPSADGASWFLIAERDDQRYKLAESLILEAVYPMLLAVPVLALLIWWLLGVGLGPVRQLATDLSQREAKDLQPLPNRPMPYELKQLVRSANDLLRRLAASFEREKRFSADAAHELRTPIAALRLHSENLAALPQSDPDSMRHLQDSIERMAHLVEQILVLNRLEPDQLRASFTPLSLRPLVQQVIAQHIVSIEEKSQQITLSGEDVWLQGDAFALTSLVSNLVGNASKYSPAGSEIKVIVTRRDQQAIVEIMDQGPGIAPDQYERVVDRFYRVGGDRHASPVAGCGLGLSIAKLAVDLHRGEMQFAPASAHQGLKVTVRLPGVMVAPSAGKPGAGSEVDPVKARV